ncbi:ABC transporter permease [Trinickia symbiotica]|uniref:ABC transporter permease n=1 Tax=Trinickia symbiotica TaxID=863227 RepID=UPI0021592FAF|nr:ABC transporter permease [Trinickia symbiotica]
MSELSSRLPAAPRARRASEARAPWLLAAPALLLFLGLLVVPMIMIALLSFHAFDGTLGILPAYTWANYSEVLGDPYYHDIFARTAGLALIVTALSIALGVPETLILARMKAPWRSVFLLIVLGPLLISVVVRTLGWAILMGREGLINQALLALHLTDSPLRFLFTLTGVTIALVHVLVPFMVISVWASIQKLDAQVENAGRSLGGSRFTVFRRIVFPQLLPGVLSGSIIVFALAASAFATPAIIGGRRLKVVATAAYDEFLSTLNWPLGASIAVLLLIANVAIIIGCNRLVEKRFAAVFES